MIKYLGSKRLLVPRIVAVVEALPSASSVVDLFSGTSRVGLALKQRGFRVLANDHNAYAQALARCYVQADAEEVAARASRLLAELDALPGAAGWFTQRYCEDARYFQPKNGARIEAIRTRIGALALEPELEAVLLTALMEAADRVDSTTGVQMAYLKSWAARSHNDLRLSMPELSPRARRGKGEAHGLDALEAASVLEGDVAYIDPPYNQHSYLGNYHVWETLVRFDEPDTFGIACKRIDVRERQSAFNSRPRFKAAFARLIERVRARTLVVSFSDEGHLSCADLVSVLETRGEVFALAIDFKRYVGAQIGIYNPRGQKVGRAGHLRNREHLFVVGDGADRVAGLVRASELALPAGPRARRAAEPAGADAPAAID